MAHSANNGRLLIALLLLALPAPSFAQPNCQLARVSSIAFGTDEYGGIYVPITMAGHDENLLVDTGSIYGMLSSDVADELKLSRRAIDMFRMRLKMVDGKRLDQYVVADSVKLGDLAADKMGFVVMPADRLPSQIAGTLGPDVMHNYDVDFDFGGGKFNLFSQNHCEGQVVYWTRQPYAQISMRLDEFWHILFPVVLDGQHLTATLDTGSSRSFLRGDVAKEMFGWDGKSTPAFKSLVLEDVTVKHPDVAVVPGDSGDGPQIVIGMGILRRLHLYIAYKEQKIYVTPVDAH